MKPERVQVNTLANVATPRDNWAIGRHPISYRKPPVDTGSD